MQPFDYLSVIPPFIAKLWKMTEDPKTDDIIRWNKNGRCILIFNELKFRYNVLAQYYKHTNMSSFIRQLNMYGFHKISIVLNCETTGDEKPTYQFVHPCFQKGQYAMLESIKRKAASRVVYDSDLDMINTNSELTRLRNRQNECNAVINNFKQENMVLWREIVKLQQKQQNYQQLLNKLIQFFVTAVQPSARFKEETGPNKCSLMIQDNPKNIDPTESPTIHEIVSNSTPPHNNVDTTTIPDVLIQSSSSTRASEHENFHVDFEELTDPTINQIELPDDFISFSNGFPDDSNLYLKNLKEVYLNSSMHDPLLTSILNDINIVPKYDSSKMSEMDKNSDQNDMSVATRSNSPYSWLLSLPNTDDTEVLNTID